MANKNLRLERKQHRTEENKAFILKAAENVFAQKGYSLSTVDDIAEEAQFSKATIYRYFNSKREIFLEIIFHSFDEASKKIKNIQLKEMCSEEKLKELISYVTAYYHKMKNITRIFFMERSSMMKILDIKPKEFLLHSPFHPRIPDNFMDKMKEINSQISEIINEGILRGEFRKIDPKDAAFIFGAMLRGFYFRGPVYEKDYTLKESTELLHSFFLNGIKKERKA